MHSGLVHPWDGCGFLSQQTRVSCQSLSSYSPWLFVLYPLLGLEKKYCKDLSWKDKNYNTGEWHSIGKGGSIWHTPSDARKSWAGLEAVSYFHMFIFKGKVTTWDHKHLILPLVVLCEVLAQKISCVLQRAKSLNWNEAWAHCLSRMLLL